VTTGVALGLLLTWPRMQRISNTMGEVRDEHAAHVSSGETRRIVEAVQAEVAQLAERVAGFDQQVPVGERLGLFLEELSRSAQQHGLRAEEIQPGRPVASLTASSGQVMAMPLSCTLYGPFEGVFGLLKELERMPRLTTVERLEAKMVQGDSRQVTAELTLRLYYRPEPARAGAAAPPLSRG
jgi:Tfp pilus assembly protein PilO